ncbi:MAG: carbohydrate ABC transporter permease [Candidatus Nanopelagicales bacterium]
MIRNSFVNKLIIYLTSGLVAFFVLIPLYVVTLTSLQLERDIRSPEINVIPQYLDFRHYLAVFQPDHIVPVLPAMRNSLIVSLLAALIAVLIATPAAYALNRMHFPKSKLILGVLISVYILPTLLFIIPLYIAWVQLGLFDSYVGLLIPYVAFLLPFTVWILGSFMKSIPIEIEEAAKVDGASTSQVLRKIMIPLLRPGLFACLLFGFILSWVEFATPLIFTSDIKMITVSLGLYRSTVDIQIGQLAAAAVITTLPVLLITIIFQKQIQEVILAGANR